MIGGARKGFLAVLVFVPAVGCGAAIGEAPRAEEEAEVVFSVANRDRLAPVALMRVGADGRTLIYGEFPPSEGGGYLYSSQRLPARKTRIRAVSEGGGQRLESERTVLLEDRAWIVVTRLRDVDSGPRLEIQVSYEKSHPWQTED